jgi:hypothetical protein
VHDHHYVDYTAELPAGVKVVGIGVAGVSDETDSRLELALDRSQQARRSGEVPRARIADRRPPFRGA